MEKTRKNKKGFTLLEILFVILIIGIIMTVIVIAISITAKERAEVAKGLQFADSVRAQLSGNLIAWWKFDEGNGTTAKDSWGGNNGTIIGGATWVKGVTGKAPEFNGTSNFVEVQDDPSLELNDSFTLVAWIYSEGSTNNQEIMWKMDTTPLRGFHFTLKRNMILRCMSHSADGSSGFIKSGNILTLNQWHFVACVRDTTGPMNNKMRLYVYGEQAASPTTDNSSDITNNTPLYIGVNAAGDTKFKGIIDEVQIYGEALTAQEIQQRYVESAPSHGIALK